MLQASLNTQFKKPVTPIPGVFRVEIWSEGIDGRRITGEQQPCPVNSYLPGFLALWAVFSNILAALLHSAGRVAGRGGDRARHRRGCGLQHQRAANTAVMILAPRQYNA